MHIYNIYYKNIFSNIFQTTESQMLIKEQGENAGAQNSSEEVLYRIDIPANRYDLLCLEGLVAGLLVFQGKLVFKKIFLTLRFRCMNNTKCKEVGV